MRPGEMGRSFEVSLFFSKDGAEVRQNHIGGDGEVAVAGHNEVRVFAGGFDISLVHGARRFKVLTGDGFKGATAFIDIAVDATDQANVGRDIYENF